MERVSKKIVLLITILLAAIVTALSVVMINFKPAENNDVNTGFEIASVTPKDNLNEAVSINTGYGDGIVTGEILIGGSPTGHSGHAYWDAPYTNGYCFNKGANLYGTFDSGEYLYNGGSAYSNNNAHTPGSVRWLLDNILRMNMTNGGVSDEEINFYKNNLKNIMEQYRAGSSASLNSLSNTQIFQAQQYAFWRYTNNVEGVAIPYWADSGSAQADLYNALIKGANANANYQSNGQTVATLSQASECKMVEDGNDVLVGPFNITNSTGRVYKFSYSNLKLDNTTNAKVFRADKTTEMVNNQYYTYQGQVYIRFYNTNISQAGKTYNVSGKMNVLSYTTNATYWTNGYLQPVVTLSRAPKTNSIDIKLSKKNDLAPGEYQINVVKADEAGNNVNLTENIFEIRKNGEILNSTLSEEDKSKVQSDMVTNVALGTKDTIEIKEVTAPEGYLKYDKTIKLEMTAEDNGRGILEIYPKALYLDDVKQEHFPLSGSFQYDNGNLEINYNRNNGTVIVKLKNNLLTGSYKLNIFKTDASGENGVNGSKFDVKQIQLDASNNFVGEWGNVSLIGNEANFESTEMAINSVEGSDLYEIVESTIPAGYLGLDKKVVLQVSKKIEGNKYIISEVKVLSFDLNEEIVSSSLSNEENIIGVVNSENNTVTYESGDKKYTVTVDKDNVVKVFVANKKIDLALKKTITKVNDLQVNLFNGFNTTRDITSAAGLGNINADGVDTSALKNSTNADYYMNKTPVQVAVGDKVEYSIKVFNEGEVKARASRITDYIPNGLRVTGVKYQDQDLATTAYSYDEEHGVLAIDLTENGSLINPFRNSTLSKDEIIVICEVKEGARGILTNVAEISEYMTEDGVVETDIDSTSNNWNAPDGENKLENSKDSNAWRDYQKDKIKPNFEKDYLAQDEGVNGNKGDDDDFDKLMIVGTEDVQLTIKKVNAEDTTQGVNDVAFNITKKFNDEAATSQNNVATTNAQIIDTQTVSGLGSNTIEYTIEEVENPNYIQLDGTIKLVLETKQGLLDNYKLLYKSKGSDNFTLITPNYCKERSKTYKLSNSNGNQMDVTIELSADNVNVIIPNKRIEDITYGLRLRKVSSGTNTAMQGVKFNVVNDTNTQELISAGTEGYTDVITKNVTINNFENADNFVINETDLGANTGYTVLAAAINVQVNKSLTQAGVLKVDNYVISIGNKSVTVDERINSGNINVIENGVSFTINAKLDTVENVKTLTITVPNAPSETVNLKLLKVSSKDGSAIAGTGFSVYKYGTNTLVYNGECLAAGVNIEDRIEAGNQTIEYEIVENYAATGFVNTLSGKSIKLTINVLNGVVQTAEAKVLNADKTEAEDQTAASVAVENGVAVVTVQNPPVEKNIDLALKKVITKVDGNDVKANSTVNFPEAFERTTDGKMRINTAPLQNGGHDAEYYLNKTPIEVLKGSKITYDIRIYNEGEEDATAAQIIDYLPNNMRFDSVSYHGATLTEGTDYTYNSQTNTLRINVLESKNLIPKYDATNDVLSMDYVTVEATVLDSAEGLLTNVAEISKYVFDDDGEIKEISKDVDSQSGNWINNVDRKTENNETVDRNSGFWTNYTGNLTGERRNNVEEGAFKNYLGEEDDDDFEKVKVVELDLALKKIITKIGDKTENQFSENVQRFQDVEGERNVKVNANALARLDSVTTAEYELNKTPITVGIGDTISYQIRIYNEGSINATASEIKDYIPKGLKFDSIYAEDSDTPLTSGFSYDEDTNVLTITSLKNNLIDKYSGNRVYPAAPSYKYVTVKCQVTGDTTGILTNVAEISKYQTIYGDTTKDRDSETIGEGEWQAPEGTDKNTLDGKSGSNWSNYYDTTVDGEFNNYPGQQDDDDFEKILVIGYKFRIKKISDWEPNGIANLAFTINGEEYTTDENGMIDLGWTGIYAGNAIAGEFVIRETNSEDYVMLNEPITLKLYQPENSAQATLSAYELKYGDNASEPVEIPGTTRVLKYIDVVSRQYMVLDIIVDENGCYDIELKIINRHKDLDYDIFLRKVDDLESANGINGSKFEVTPLTYLWADTANFGRIGTAKEFETTDDGYSKVGRIALRLFDFTFRNQTEVSDIIKIEEIETPDNYFKIADDQDIYLTVNKKAIINDKENYTSLTVDSIKLTLNKDSLTERSTEAGNKVTLENVALAKSDKTVNVTAELVNVDDPASQRSIPTIIITVPNVEKEFDLALRKYIITAGEEDINRWGNPAIDINSLLEGTTATYNNAKDPVQVHLRDTVLYGISVYNEGEKDGYAELVMDDVPEGLEMIEPGDGTNETSTVNAKYRWKMYKLATENDANAVVFDGVSYVETTDASEAKVIVTDYLSREQGVVGEDGINQNLIGAFDKETMTAPLSRELRVEFKVKSTNKENDIITNKAQIIKHSDKDGNTDIIDRDSTPNKWEDSPRDDDQDIEHLIVLRDKLYDLALRKFITSVNGEKLVSSREPKVDCSKLVAGGHDAEYYHSKEPVLVNSQDVVEYTIRVYNEGKDDAYANVVIDDVPVNAEMIAPDYTADGEAVNVNAKYRWLMFREIRANESAEGQETLIYDGKVYVLTNEPTEAVIIKTDYLSRELNAEDNLIKAFDVNEGKMTKANYRDIKVEFKIKETEPNKFVTNYAQIFEMLGEDGQDVIDIDSTPGAWIDGEDDQDIEVVRVGKFDLALYKWVTQAIVIEDGNVTEYNSEHTQMDKSNMVNVSIPKDKLNDITVKFKYQIKVENEGTVAGNALEVKDHIPAGLKFLAEDNTEFGWVAVDDQTVTTDYLKDTVLQPGESAEVTIVLTWINGSKNFGEKVNYAEISKDYNEFGWPDIDSTPDNFNEIPREDDEDSDVVLLQIRTGIESIAYVAIAAVVMVIVAGGVVGIKKYVVNK